MRETRFIVAGALIGILAVGLGVGCSKDSSPTSPTGGGGPSNTPFDSGTLVAPATFDHVFPVTGTVGYHCTFHRSRGMVGTVVVAAGGADSVAVTGSGFTFSPSSVTISPGGKVHWMITGGTHTVTSD